MICVRTPAEFYRQNYSNMRGYIYSLYGPREDLDDICSYVMLQLIRSNTIAAYDAARGASWDTYILLCIHRAAAKYLRSRNNTANRPEYPIDEHLDDARTADNPDDAILGRLTAAKITAQFEDHLTHSPLPATTLRVWHLLKSGHTNVEIAREIHYTPQATQFHINSIRRRFREWRAGFMAEGSAPIPD